MTSGTVLAPESAGVQWGEASGKGADLDCTPVRARALQLTLYGWLSSLPFSPNYRIRLQRVRIVEPPTRAATVGTGIGPPAEPTVSPPKLDGDATVAAPNPGGEK